jgi:hypothetical protein
MGPVKPTSGAWQVAQDIQSGLEILSKYSSLPNLSRSERSFASNVILKARTSNGIKIKQYLLNMMEPPCEKVNIKENGN